MGSSPVYNIELLRSDLVMKAAPVVAGMLHVPQTVSLCKQSEAMKREAMKREAVMTS
jgi:hypothetical protein